MNVTYKIFSDNSDSTEVVLKLNVTRTLRPQIKTGVYVPSKYFVITSGDKSNGYNGTLRIPNKSKLNYEIVKGLSDTQDRLQDIENRLRRIIEVSDETEISSKYLMAALKKTNGVAVEDIDLITIKGTTPKFNTANLEEVITHYIKNSGLAYSSSRSCIAVLFGIIRYERYQQLTANERYLFDVAKVEKNDLVDFFDYYKNEYHLYKTEKRTFAKIFASLPKVSGMVGEQHKTRTQIMERGQNSIIKAKKYIRAMFNWLIKNEIITNNPFKGLEVGTERFGTPYYINIEERNQIANFDLSDNKALEAQRDIFVFHCMVGCRVSDLVRLTDKNIIDGVLEYIPIKTKNHSNEQPRIPLTSEALRLIEKYKGIDRRGRLFPFISAQKYNDALKELFAICGITRNVIVRDSLTGNEVSRPLNEIVSSHIARRTFIGNAYKVVQDPNLIARMSGHSVGSKAFARYRKIEDDTLAKVLNEVESSASEQHNKSAILEQLAQLNAMQLQEIINQLNKYEYGK